jgi:hypothetical protein
MRSGTKRVVQHTMDARDVEELRLLALQLYGAGHELRMNRDE